VDDFLRLQIADTVIIDKLLLRVEVLTDVSYSIIYPGTIHETFALLVKTVFSFAETVKLCGCNFPTRLGFGGTGCLR